MGSEFINVGSIEIQKLIINHENLKLSISNSCIFCSCMYGGPIAIGSLIDNKSAKWKILILTQTNRFISTIEAFSILTIAWSRDQKLIVVDLNGGVLLFNALGELLCNFDLGKETSEFGILETIIYSFDSGTGLAVLNKEFNFYGFDSINNRALWRVKDLEKKSKSLTCWTVISVPAKPTLVFFCVKTKFYIGQMQSSIELLSTDWAFKDGTYFALAPTFDNVMIACAHDSGQVQIISNDFNSLLYSIDFFCLIKSPYLKNKLLWFEKKAIIMQTKASSLEFCDILTGTKKTLSFENQFFVGIENDGVRIFTKDYLYLYCLAPKYIKNVFNITSRDSSSVLYDIYLRLYKNKNKDFSYNLYDYLNIIGDNMSSAVDKCLETATHLFSKEEGKYLLKRYDRSKFVEIVNKMNLLNDTYYFGFPMSYNQLNELSVESYINRLISLRQWEFAINICNYMNIEAEKGVYKVLAYWCRALFNEFKKDSKLGEINQNVLSEKIINQLNIYPGVSFADIAIEAAKKELYTVAKILVNNESNLTRQIHALLKMKDIESALEKSVISQQPDLLHLVLNHIKKTKTSTEFQSILNKVPQAFFLYQSYVYDETPNLAIILSKHNNDFVRQGIYYLDQAEKTFSQFEPTKMIENLVEASRAFQSLKDYQATQLIDQSVQLINEQFKLEENFNTVLTDKSPREMFIWAVQNDQMSIADSIRKQHKFDEKQTWLWTVQGFAKGNHWSQIEHFGNLKKSPLGYIPLIEACFKYGNPVLARRFIDKLTKYEDEIKALLILKDNLSAAKLASDKLDMNMLQNIRRRLPVLSDGWKEITALIEKLNKRS